METWENPELVTLWVLIIAGFLGVFVVFNFLLVRSYLRRTIRTKLAKAKAQATYEQNILKATIETQESERDRIAADLHDSLIGKLAVVKMKMEIEEENPESIGLMDESIKLARRISHDLSPPLLGFNSLVDLVKELVHPWKNKIQIADFYDVRNEYNYSENFKKQIIRIVQEMLVNITKHAEAEKVTIRYRQTEHQLALLVADNGKGFDMTEQRKGIGLRNIESRVNYLKGKYRMKSEVNQGTSTLFVFQNTNI